MQDKQAKVDYWLESSDRDAQVATEMYQNGHYNYALFFWQMVLEKLLKALIIHRTDTHPLPVHDLVKLAKLAQIELSPTQ